MRALEAMLKLQRMNKTVILELYGMEHQDKENFEICEALRIGFVAPIYEFAKLIDEDTAEKLAFDYFKMNQSGELELNFFEPEYQFKVGIIGEHFHPFKMAHELIEAVKTQEYMEELIGDIRKFYSDLGIGIKSHNMDVEIPDTIDGLYVEPDLTEYDRLSVDRQDELAQAINVFYILEKSSNQSFIEFYKQRGVTKIDRRVLREALPEIGTYVYKSGVLKLRQHLQAQREGIVE